MTATRSGLDARHGMQGGRISAWHGQPARFTVGDMARLHDHDVTVVEQLSRRRYVIMFHSNRARLIVSDELLDPRRHEDAA